MAGDTHDGHWDLVEQLLEVLSKPPKLSALGDAWQIARKVLRRRSVAGPYEVLEYESTPELHDRGGERATFAKREKVR
jgi:hypothetical protein